MCPFEATDVLACPSPVQWRIWPAPSVAQAAPRILLSHSVAAEEDPPQPPGRGIQRKAQTLVKLLKAATAPYLESDILMCLAQDPERFSRELSEGREGEYSNSDGVPWGGRLFQQGAQPEQGEEGGGEEAQGKARGCVERCLGDDDVCVYDDVYCVYDDEV